MQANFSYKYVGLLAVLVLVLGLTFVLRRWPADKHKTFSQHVAVSHAASTYYTGLFLLVLPLIMLFFVKWFVPHVQLSVWFTAWILLSSVFQLSCTLVPEVGGWKTICHRWPAGLSALTLLPPLALLSLANTLSFGQRNTVRASLLIMVLIIAFTVIQRKQSYALLLQIGYFVAFFVPVLLISYL